MRKVSEMNRSKMPASKQTRGGLGTSRKHRGESGKLPVQSSGRGSEDQSDEELVTAFQEGNEQAFVTVVNRYKHRLTRLAWSVVHNEDDAMDVVQEAFIKVYKKLHAFRGSSKLYTWLYRIVMNHSIDYVRRRPSAVIMPSDDLPHELADTDKSTRPDEHALNVELRERIFQAVDKLPEKQKKTILLREVEDLSYNEIAEIMNCSVGTIMSRLYYGRERLRALLEPYLRDGS